MDNLQTIEHRLKAVASARRLAILKFLKKHHSATVTDIASALGVSVFAASQHLRILRSAGIVAYKKRGLYVTYRLELPQQKLVKQVLQLL